MFVHDDSRWELGRGLDGGWEIYFVMLDISSFFLSAERSYLHVIWEKICLVENSIVLFAMRLLFSE